jgi:methylphosphotriester-DNA--protein-cysteine methyltransferase
MLFRELAPSANLAIQRFASLDEFRPHDIVGGGQSTPLAAHDFSLDRAAFVLPGSQLVLQRSSPRVLQANLGAPGSALLIPLAPNDAVINGLEVDHSTVVLTRNRVPTHIFEPRDNTYAMLRFNSPMQNRGWPEFDTGLEALRPGAVGLGHLQSVVIDLLRCASDCADPREFARLGETMQESLVAALDAILVCEKAKRPTPGSLGRHRKIVAALDEAIREFPTIPLYSEDLAVRCGISVRTLQTAVNAVHGLSLHHYLRLRRLWSVRCQLMTGAAGVSIKASARANGFWHMGEFSKIYRSAFMEAPSSTLARARAGIRS